jgi:endonuclease YncB( thermonuclease family)
MLKHGLLVYDVSYGAELSAGKSMIGYSRSFAFTHALRAALPALGKVRLLTHRATGGRSRPAMPLGHAASHRRLKVKHAFRYPCLAFLVRAVLLIGAITQPVSADISSYAFVQPDGSLRISGETIRLYGIYVPPTDQSCRTFERPIECGSRAQLALDFHIGVEFVHCEEKARQADGSLIALCRARGEDLSAWMLQRGWAVAVPDAPFEYVALERIARAKGLGVWGFPVDIIRKR